MVPPPDYRTFVRLYTMWFCSFVKKKNRRKRYAWESEIRMTALDHTALPECGSFIPVIFISFSADGS